MDTSLLLILLVVVALVAGTIGYFISLKRTAPNRSNLIAQIPQEELVVVEDQHPPDKLILGDGSSSWGEIARYDTFYSSYGFDDFEVSREAKLSLSNLFQHAPELATNITNVTSNLYTLSASPELQKGLASGSLAWMQALGSDGGIRGTVVNKSTGLIQGQGVLLQAGALQSLNVATAVWQVMAIITAQKFVADINKQLGQITLQLDRLMGYLEQKDHAELLGSLKYLTEIRDAISGQKLNRDELTVYLTQVENIELQTLKYISFYSSQMTLLTKEFKREDLNKGFLFFGDSSKVEKAKKLLDDYEQASEKYLVTMALRTLAAQVRGSLPFNQDFTLLRLQNTRAELDKWLSQKGEFYQLVETRTRERDSWLNDEKPQEEFLKFVERNRLKTKEMQTEVATMLINSEKKVKAQIEGFDKPLVLLVELDGQNQVTRLSKIQDSYSGKPRKNE